MSLVYQYNASICHNLLLLHASERASTWFTVKVLVLQQPIPWVTIPLSTQAQQQNAIISMGDANEINHTQGCGRNQEQGADPNSRQDVISAGGTGDDDGTQALLVIKKRLPPIMRSPEYVLVAIKLQPLWPTQATMARLKDLVKAAVEVTVGVR
ncbi:hypothetical protein BJV82DRAFT_663963 [Fennellomyces sp. T-0311]|nr:hypothetical protein BJV82DRAFT_663963 [Fennellomyces sp. T-0311]